MLAVVESVLLGARESEEGESSLAAVLPAAGSVRVAAPAEAARVLEAATPAAVPEQVAVLDRPEPREATPWKNRNPTPQ